jgi:hypothetical protein
MPQRGGPLPSSWGPVVGVFLAAAVAFSLIGTHGALLHDPAVYVYGGQRLLDGVPPYVSIFDIKAPLGTFLCAAAIGIGRRVGADDVVAARLLFFLISCGCVAGVYLLTLVLFESRWQAVLTSALFIGFRGFGVHAMDGPLPSSAALLFVILALVLGAERRWFVAGLCGALAGLTWQPTGAYALAVVALAWLQSDTKAAGRRAAVLATAGVLLPIAAMVAYFVAKGALFALVDATVLYPFLFHDSPAGFGPQLARFTTALTMAYGGGGLMIAVGLFMIGPLYVWRTGAEGERSLAHLVGDRFAIVLLTFPAPFVWSLFDFQAYPDLFVFLPYAALGFGWVLAVGLDAVADRLELEARGHHVLSTLVAGLLLLAAARQYRNLETTYELEAQRQSLERIVSKHGEDARTVAIGAPQAMVLLGRTNPTRYGIALRRGVVSHIEARHPGGFRGWLRSLRDQDPEVVIFHQASATALDETQRQAWQSWKSGYRRSLTLRNLYVAVPRDS